MSVWFVARAEGLVADVYPASDVESRRSILTGEPRLVVSQEAVPGAVLAGGGDVIADHMERSVAEKFRRFAGVEPDLVYWSRQEAFV